MMLPAQAVVLVLCCLMIGSVRTKLTSNSDIYRELEEVLKELNEETRAETLNGDAIDPMERMTTTRSYQEAKDAIKEGKQLLEEEFLRRNIYYNTGIDKHADNSSAASMSGLNDILYGSVTEYKENKTLVALFAAEILLKSTNFTLTQLQEDKGIKRAYSEEAGNCDADHRPNVTPCSTAEEDSPYRSISGRCNNIQNPLIGAHGATQRRLLPAQYENGIQNTRKTGVNGGALPSPRAVSNKVLRNPNDLATPTDDKLSVMAMVWGQALDHDLTETTQTKGRKDTNVGCCTLSVKKRNERRTQCATIKIAPNDHHFNNVDCMDLVRSVPSSSNHCILGVREQINAVTGFVDASHVYGSEDDLAEKLRLKKDGLLKVAGDDLLPPDDDSVCVLPNKDTKNTRCFKAGDIRVNENPHLGAIHIAFVRYHNILAERFRATGNLADDEKIYQLCRKIIGAIMQHVTYSAWLPDIIGEAAMTKYKLNPLDKTVPYKDPYKQNTQADTFNEFSAAAMRFGHSMVMDTLLLVNKDNQIRSPSTALDEVFFNPELLYEESNLQDLSRWIASYPCKKGDPAFVSAIQDNLFGGLDLAALNTQRGREHGLPSYWEYRKLCELSVADDFASLEHHIPEVQNKLKLVYDNPKDIDLFVGAMTETNIDAANVGPTFACLLGKQFQPLKEGDRYWYERPLPQGFNKAQRDNIENVRLSKIICEVFKLTTIQENIFRIPKVDELVDCASLSDIDVNLWIQ